MGGGGGEGGVSTDSTHLPEQRLVIVPSRKVICVGFYGFAAHARDLPPTPRISCSLSFFAFFPADSRAKESLPAV